MPKYRLTPAISLARNYNTVGVSEAPTYNAAVVKVGGYTLVRSIINGSAVFPMDDLFEIIAQDGNAQTTISLEVDGQAIASSPLYLLKGASVRAMTNNAQADTPISWPQPSKIVVFPAFDYSEQILVNSYTGAMQDFAFTDADSGRREVYSRVDPVFSLPMTFFREFGGGERQLIVSTGGTTGEERASDGRGESLRQRIVRALARCNGIDALLSLASDRARRRRIRRRDLRNALRETDTRTPPHDHGDHDPYAP